MKRSCTDVVSRQYDAVWTPSDAPYAPRRPSRGENRTCLDLPIARSANARHARSVCEGALSFAGAVLLDGFRATTHWSFGKCSQAYDRIDVAGGHRCFARDRDRLTGGTLSNGHDETRELARLLSGEQVGENVQRATRDKPKPSVGVGLAETRNRPMPPWN